MSDDPENDRRDPDAETPVEETPAADETPAASARCAARLRPRRPSPRSC